MPNKVALTSAMITSPAPVTRVSPATKAPGVTFLEEHREDKAPARPTRTTRGDSRSATTVAARTPGYDERLDRVDAHHPQRVELLTDGACTEVGAHAGGSGAGDHQHRHDRPDLGDRAESRTGTEKSAAPNSANRT